MRNRGGLVLLPNVTPYQNMLIILEEVIAVIIAVPDGTGKL